MKRMGAFGFFLLFLAGIAIVNLRNMADQSTSTITEPTVADLAERPWRLRRLVDEQPSADASFELIFAPDFSLSLRGACNRFHGNFTYADGQFSTGDLAGTRRACEADIMRADTLMLEALASTSSLSLAGDRLLLKGADDALHGVLVRQPAETSGNQTNRDETNE